MALFAEVTEDYTEQLHPIKNDITYAIERFNHAVQQAV